MTAPTRYDAVAMGLHWTIAAAIAVNIVVVLAAPEDHSPERLALMSFHMALGLTVLVLSLLRLAWRLTHRMPAPPAGLNTRSRFVGAATHVLLYVLMIAIPLAGWLMVSVRGFTPSWFGLFAWPLFPGLAGLGKAAAHGLGEAFESVHIVLGFGIVALVLAHVAAALHHHYGRKDNVLLRMLPGTRLRDGV